MHVPFRVAKFIYNYTRITLPGIILLEKLGCIWLYVGSFGSQGISYYNYKHYRSCTLPDLESIAPYHETHVYEM